MGAPEATAHPRAEWDEAQCTAALAQLEQLQAQIDDLRLAIPRIIEPIHRPLNASTFKLYSQGVIGSQNGIKALNEQWKAPEMQATFEHVKDSFGANADLSARTSVPSHGWVDKQRKAQELQKGVRDERPEESVATLTDEEFLRIVQEFHETYPDIKLKTPEGNRIITTQFVSGSLRLDFHINIEQEANDRHKVNAECLGTMEPFASISRSIKSRPQANDLKQLLDMIAAYKKVKGISCAKCGSLIDNHMLTPTARRSTQVSGMPVWEALHEGCLQ